MAPAINPMGLYQPSVPPTLFDIAQLLQVFQQAYNPFENVLPRALYSPPADEEFVVEYYVEEMITIEFSDTPSPEFEAPSLLEVVTIEVGPRLFDEPAIPLELLLDAPPASPILEVEAKTAPTPTPPIVVEEQAPSSQEASNGELRKREAAADPGSPILSHSAPKLTSISPTGFWSALKDFGAKLNPARLWSSSSSDTNPSSCDDNYDALNGWDPEGAVTPPASPYIHEPHPYINGDRLPPGFSQDKDGELEYLMSIQRVSHSPFLVDLNSQLAAERAVAAATDPQSYNPSLFRHNYGEGNGNPFPSPDSIVSGRADSGAVPPPPPNTPNVDLDAARFRILQSSTPWVQPADIPALIPPPEVRPHPFGYQPPQREPEWVPSKEPGKLDPGRLAMWEGNLITPKINNVKRDESGGESPCLPSMCGWN
jgi:hypothetical protein